MYNCYSSISTLLSELPALSSYLLDAGNYLAHLPGEAQPERAPEILEMHINLVNSYLAQLTEKHGLDPVIDKIISGISPDISIDSGNYIKKLFVYTIVFHDFGKVNEHFQANKMQNPLFKHISGTSLIGSTHSSLSAFIYLSFHLNEIVTLQNSDVLLLRCCLYLSYSIFKHHSKKLDDNSEQTIGFAESNAKQEMQSLRSFLSSYIHCFQYSIPSPIINLIGNSKAMEHILGDSLPNSFQLYLLCKLNFSLLTASDYLATNEYMNGETLNNFGTLDKERIEEIYRYVTQEEWVDKSKGEKNYNKKIYDELASYKLQRPIEKSGSNLNTLRKEMAIEVITNVRNFAHSNLFYIEAPTGGGKTNLSLLTTLELLKIHEGKYNKVFYIFPFTTLVTQTFGVAKDMLGLNEEEMVELHSRAGFRDGKKMEDGAYGNQQLNYIYHLFANFPFCFLSHIKFFDILKTNEKEANYLLHRLSNSIVVIDEIQSYNPSQWDKLIYFIRQYSALFNIKFILMSATLPKLDKLAVMKEQIGDVTYLLPDAKAIYFRNPNFSERVSFNFDLFDRKDLTLEELADKVIATSRTYTQYDFGPAKPEGSVYTIIEFIYKQSSTNFYKIIESYDFFDQIYVLSGTILDFRRKEIILNLKHASNRQKKILLITTQVVEAGVDIDMDVAFKDRSIIDSDEQLAGRVNRNVNKQYCTVYLFNYDRESAIYGKDARFEITNKYIKISEYRRILEEKDFDALYDQVFAHRNAWNQREMAENFSDYLRTIQQLKFASVHTGFKLIKQENISCFIPLDMPLTISIGIEPIPVFTQSELKFLAQQGVFPTASGTIQGKHVFDLYMHSIHNKVSFTKQKVRMKLLQSILSKYIFSIFFTDKMYNQLLHFTDLEKSGYGYMYLERWIEIYSIGEGLDSRKTGGAEETQFL